MADLDAELLALAGGDDSSDEETSVPTQHKLASPPLLSSHEQPESEQSGEMARKGAARLVQRPKKVKKVDEEPVRPQLWLMNNYPIESHNSLRKLKME